MNNTVEETRRELFEQSTAIPEGVGWSVETNSYTGKNFWVVQYAWETFNAALDAVVISLPESREIIDEGGWLSYVVDADEVRTAIESTNLGIKIK